MNFEEPAIAISRECAPLVPYGGMRHNPGCARHAGHPPPQCVGVRRTRTRGVRTASSPDSSSPVGLRRQFARLPIDSAAGFFILEVRA